MERRGTDTRCYRQRDDLYGDGLRDEWVVYGTVMTYVVMGSRGDEYMLAKAERDGVGQQQVNR